MTQYEMVVGYTSNVVNRLLKTPSESAARASLANLRRGVGHKPGELPQLFGSIITDMPEELLGTRGANRSEWAVYTAVTLFALHQQGKDRSIQPMHRAGISLGDAANRLIKEPDDRNRVGRRFYPAATAESIEELTYHLRGLVTLFRANDIPLDFAMLAGDIYRYQFPEKRDEIRMKWCRDFSRYHGENRVSEENN